MISEAKRITYEVSKQVYEKKITPTEGINKLVELLNMNKGSAQIIIVQIFPKLIRGEKFTRTLSVEYFNTFLKCIEKDYGVQSLKLSLIALRKHIDYIKTKGDSKKRLRIVVQNYIESINIKHDFSVSDEIEQEEIIKYFKKNSTENHIISELEKIEYHSNNDKVTVNSKIYKRHNKAIALIKILRNFECQICGYSVTKKDGTKYIEAAHITPKSEKGDEKSDNIILLCPNHHKEFDFGDRKILERDSNKIIFKLNGVIHNLSLKFQKS